MDFVSEIAAIFRMVPSENEINTLSAAFRPDHVRFCSEIKKKVAVSKSFIILCLERIFFIYIHFINCF